jgi:peroxiredoxin Q/BCP
MGNRNIIFIYPKNDTSSCTKENLAFSENVKEFDRLNINIFGLSKDGIESHQKFTNKYNLEVELISDPDIHLIKQLGSWVKKSMYGKEYLGVERSTFLIDENNVITEIWRKVKVAGHVQNVLDFCKKI